MSPLDVVLGEVEGESVAAASSGVAVTARGAALETSFLKTEGIDVTSQPTTPTGGLGWILPAGLLGLGLWIAFGGKGKTS